MDLVWKEARKKPLNFTFLDNGNGRLVSKVSHAKVGPNQKILPSSNHGRFFFESAFIKM
jgi:hypothetical protein